MAERTISIAVDVSSCKTCPCRSDSYDTLWHQYDAKCKHPKTKWMKIKDKEMFDGFPEFCALQLSDNEIQKYRV